MLTTTLNEIRDKRPCEPGWAKLLKHLGKTKADDTPLAFTTILESNGIDDAMWCLRTLENLDKEQRLLACDFAETALKFVPEGEDRPAKAIEVARRYANGEAAKSELDDARDAAYAAYAADAAYAAYAAYAADAAAADAADAAYAAYAAVDADAAYAAYAAAAYAAVDAAREDQAKIFLKWLEQFKEKEQC